MNLTEFGRDVHAEMSAIVSAARRGTSTEGAYLYCTTFPCHNCAKHIIAAGIRQVVYVEPYAKSFAAEFHLDSGHSGITDRRDVRPHSVRALHRGRP
jgi:deoxycytidylate deaminase